MKKVKMIKFKKSDDKQGYIWIRPELIAAVQPQFNNPRMATLTTVYGVFIYVIDSVEEVMRKMEEGS